MESEDTTLAETLERLNGLGEATVGSDDGRRLWLELLKTITDCLPIDPAAIKDGEPVSIKERPLSTRLELYIDSIESEYFTDLNRWNTEAVQSRYQEFLDERAAGIAESRRAAAPADGEDGEEVVEEELEEEVAEGAPDEDALPFSEGPGWVIQVKGHHFQRSGRMKDKQYVRKTLMEQLENGKVRLPMPDGSRQKVGEFTAKEMGIFSPILVEGKIDKSVKIANPDYRPPRGKTAADATAAAASPFAKRNPFGTPATAKEEPEDPDNPRFFYAEQYSFIVQFVWKQIPLTQRVLERKALADAARRAEDN